MGLRMGFPTQGAKKEMQQASRGWTRQTERVFPGHRVRDLRQHRDLPLQTTAKNEFSAFLSAIHDRTLLLGGKFNLIIDYSGTNKPTKSYNFMNQLNFTKHAT